MPLFITSGFGWAMCCSVSSQPPEGAGRVWWLPAMGKCWWAALGFWHPFPGALVRRAAPCCDNGTPNSMISGVFFFLRRVRDL